MIFQTEAKFHLAFGLILSAEVELKNNYSISYSNDNFHCTLLYGTVAARRAVCWQFKWQRGTAKVRVRADKKIADKQCAPNKHSANR